jgi:glycosyltransferase involved in cell wall biosynthesis
MKYKFGLCGPFDFQEKYTGGQSVKTREFYYGLCERIGKSNILILESTEYKKNPFLFFMKLISMLKSCEHIVIFPAQNGIKIFAPICNSFKGSNKVHYNVIGGWLPQMLESQTKLIKHMKKFDSILVETNVMKEQLQRLGLSNIYRVLNFKRLQPVETVNKCSEPIKLCYFSRVIKQKGIEDAVEVVERLNLEGYNCIFDIYGPVVDEYREQFKKLKKSFSDKVTYKGKVDPLKSIEVLKKYDLQLFPTLYKTEGIPGAIVDSYFAGVPVVASKWNSFDDVVKDGITGKGYEFGNVEEFKIILQELLDDVGKIYEMKQNCIVESRNYMANTVIRDFLEIIEKC